MNIRATGKSTVIAMIFAASAATSTMLNATMQNVEMSSLVVSYADLNLGNAEDQQTLFQRLKRAARNVCETRAARTSEEVRNSRDCYQDALGEAVSEIGNPGLLSL